jgi:chaperonin GroES
MSLKPLSNCVLIKQDVEKLSSIIEVAGTKKLFSGIVIAMGSGKKLPNGAVEPMNVAVNDHVLFGEFSGQPTTVDGEEYLMMREADIIGILD